MAGLTYKDERDIMGTDMTVWVEVERSPGRWEWIESLKPFNWRSYAMYGWLADVRNYSFVKPMFPSRGRPKDFSVHIVWYEDMGRMTWFMLDELLAVDYTQEIEDRRSVDGKSFPEGEGTKMPLTLFLGEAFAEDLEVLLVVQEKLGRVRITVGFDC